MGVGISSSYVHEILIVITVVVINDNNASRLFIFDFDDSPLAIRASAFDV